MAKKKAAKPEVEKKARILGTARGEGTTYSILFSTLRQKVGTTYSTVRGRAKELKRRMVKKWSQKNEKEGS